MTTSPEPLLSVRDLSVVFDTDAGPLPAVRGVSFDLAAGEVLSVVGESGCGKSVTALALLKLLPERQARVAGEARFDGRDLLRLPEPELRRIRGGEVAMIFQDPLTSLNPVYTAGAQVAEAIRLHRGLDRRAAWEAAVEMLHRVRIPDARQRARSFPHQLSGGQRQRVMIAMAFACEPRIVIADEPTTALDVTVQRQILDLMLELRRERGTSVLLITHDLGVVAETADRVLVFYAGQVVESGPVRAVFSRPSHPYTRLLLESLPRLEGERLRRLPVIQGQPPDPRDLPSGCPFRPRCPDADDRCLEGPPWVELDAGIGARCWRPEGASAPALNARQG